MEVAPHYKLLALFTLVTLLTWNTLSTWFTLFTLLTAPEPFDTLVTGLVCASTYKAQL